MKQLLLTLLVSSALYGASVDDLTFTLNEAGTEYSVTDCNTVATGSLDIPSTYNGLPITTIADSAFSQCKYLTNITLPNNITTIGTMSFFDCWGLTSITLPDTLVSIEYGAFIECSGLGRINIPSGVTSIGDYTFDRCWALTEIEVSVDNKNFSSADGVLYNKSISKLVACPSNVGTIQIPATVQVIGLGSFMNCLLDTILLPNTVKTIERFAFAGCYALESIRIPASVTTIGEGAFMICPSLNEVIFEGLAPSGGATAFQAAQGAVATVYENYINSFGGEGTNYSGLIVSSFSSDIDDSPNQVLYSEEDFNSILTERDAALAARDTAILQRNARLTMDEVKDARVGSTMIEVSEGKADITMTLEETSDLSDWSNATTSKMTIQVDAPEGARFYRFKMAE